MMTIRLLDRAGVFMGTTMAPQCSPFVCVQCHGRFFEPISYTLWHRANGAIEMDYREVGVYQAA